MCLGPDIASGYIVLFGRITWKFSPRSWSEVSGSFSHRCITPQAGARQTRASKKPSSGCWLHSFAMTSQLRLSNAMTSQLRHSNTMTSQLRHSNAMTSHCCVKQSARRFGSTLISEKVFLLVSFYLKTSPSKIDVFSLYWPSARTGISCSKRNFVSPNWPL